LKGGAIRLQIERPSHCCAHAQNTISTQKKASIYFAIHICQTVKEMNETLTQRVQKAIAEIRPNLQADGGDIELVGVEGGTVKVKLKGACAGCPMSTMTVKLGVESYLRKRIPEVISVETV